MDNKELSLNQKKFVNSANKQGLKIYYDYSGRGMFGKTCPSVNVDYKGELETKAKTSTDQMGMGYVIYAQN